MANIAQTQKRELESKEMIIALVDHNWRQPFSEDIKALPIKKSKGKSSVKKKSQLHYQLLCRHQKRRIMGRKIANTMI